MSVNQELLDTYAACSSSAEVIEAQQRHMDAMQETQDAVAARKSASCCLFLYSNMTSRFFPITIVFTSLLILVYFSVLCAAFGLARLIQQFAWLDRAMCSSS